MRTAMILLLLSPIVLLLAGCSGIANLQPVVSIPFWLGEAALRATTNGPAMACQRVDVTTNGMWKEYADRSLGIDRVRLQMSVANATGNPQTPNPVAVRFYLSEQGNLTAETLGTAELLVTSQIPGGMPTLQYDSGEIPLSATERQMLQDGKCYLYAVSTSPSVALDFAQMWMDIALRISRFS